MFSILFLALALIGNSYSANSPTSSLSNIRTSFRGGVQRIVFDITTENEPAYYVKKDPDKGTVSLTLETNVVANKEKALIKNLENTHYIGKVQFLNLTDEGELIITMELKAGVIKEVMTLPHPSRVVIDLIKDKTGV